MQLGRPGKWLVCLVLGAVLAPSYARPQTVAPSPPATPTPAPSPPSVPGADNDFLGRDSNVGYIDSALPFSNVRVRFDSAYGDRQPNRAEFFYARGRPGGPGLPVPEPRVDYQELSTYMEAAFCPEWSLFVEAPVRFLDPEVNAKASGFGDLNAGFKWAFLERGDNVLAFQFRTYAPTGDASRGLGTHHVSVEPALLLHDRLSERLLLEGEFRYWAPIGGTDFSGDIVRYGLGLSYGRGARDHFWITPVAEFVGWTVLGGKEQQVIAPDTSYILSAAGQTIVNAKVGVRMGIGQRGDLYVGYGHALTGDAWYRDIVRTELRLRF